MALDGVTISCIVNELQVLVGGRVDKIYMPERDEVVMAVRSKGNNYRLLMTANSSHPRVHFTRKSKENPMQPPLFCMVLRKHVSGGRIISVTQPDFERVLEICIESPDEMGDYSVKRLIVEIMGKHSNIILVGANGILDSAKRVSNEISSVRQILPGGAYSPPPSKGKRNPLLLEPSSFKECMSAGGMSIYENYSGISPVMAGEICERAGVLAEARVLTDEMLTRLYSAFEGLMDDIKSLRYSPELVLNAKGAPIEFSAVPLTCYDGHEKLHYSEISELLEYYYVERDRIYRTEQKTADLRKIVRQATERASRKKDLHIRTLRDIKNREKLKLWGELLTANIYSLKQGMTSFTAQNYYDGGEELIPLVPELTPIENAQKYFARYNKQKRTYAAVCEQMKQVDDELLYLEAVLTSLSACTDEADAEDVRDELHEQGFIKKRRAGKRGQRRSKPLMFTSADGFEIYVGKNNRQNDELTLRFAQSGDFWFHTKDIPGSHVILRTNGQTPPDAALTEAAELAAYYSKARGGSQVAVDYTLRRNVKKPSGAKPGMVIYENYKTAYVTPGITERGTSLPTEK